MCFLDSYAGILYISLIGKMLHHIFSLPIASVQEIFILLPINHKSRTISPQLQVSNLSHMTLASHHHNTFSDLKTYNVPIQKSSARKQSTFPRNACFLQSQTGGITLLDISRIKWKTVPYISNEYRA